MSRHAAFRRQPVEQNYAQQHRLQNIPAPTRGLIHNENEAFPQPGGSIIQDNWMPTMRGSKIRGGSLRHVDLHALDAEVPPLGSTLRRPVISAFEYQFGNNQRMFAAQETKLFEVTTSGDPVLVSSDRTSGNFSTAQMSTAEGNYLLAVNATGDYVLRFDGSTWVNASVGGTAPVISGPVTVPPTPVVNGLNLVYVWKYRNRLFFIEANSMNAWYLGIDSIGGQLTRIPLSGSATKGGKLLFGASWSIDAGDGIDDKCCFFTDLGEVLIFTGSNPADPNNWRQEGRYKIAEPMGMNAFFSMGGDLLILTVEGIVPLSQAITKTAEQLDLAMLTRAIKSMWRDEVLAKRPWSWTAENWTQFGGVFVTWPGGAPGKRYCAAVNNATGAWCRFVGWDATCFMRLREDMFFGTQDGLILQANRTGFDDAHLTGEPAVMTGTPYTCTLVGGWEMFSTGGAHAIWHQARASFTSNYGQPFIPQLSAMTNYEIALPLPPPVGQDPGLLDVWDQGLWDVALWDQPSAVRPPVRNTMWVSIGRTGYSHAPVVQVQIAQRATPDVELIAIAALYERGGNNVD